MKIDGGTANWGTMTKNTDQLSASELVVRRSGHHVTADDGGPGLDPLLRVGSL